MFGIILRVASILLFLGLVYVSLKRAVLRSRVGSGPAADGEARLGADDLVKCPRCGVYGVKGQPCATPGCTAARG